MSFSTYNVTSTNPCDCPASSYTAPLQPIVIALAIPAAHWAIQAVRHIHQKGITSVLRNIAFRIPSVRSQYDQKLQKQFAAFQASTCEKWKCFGAPFREIPEEGVSPQEIGRLLEHYQKETEIPLQQHYFSGAIYPGELLKPKSDSTQMLAAPLSIKDLFKKAFEISYLWNPLHGKEFAIGSFIQYQLIQMIGHEFGASGEEIAGFATSGGTESLMLAVKAYLIWAEREKGIAREKAVIIAPQTIHAAVLKAASDFLQEGQLV